MDEFAIFNAMIDLSYAFFALFALFVGLRILDHRAGRPWTTVIGIIMGENKNEALATSIYYSARWIGACLVVAAFVSS